MTTRGKAFVDLSGVVVLVIDINFYNIKTLGRHKGRKLAQKLQHPVHVNPKSLLTEVVDPQLWKSFLDAFAASCLLRIKRATVSQHITKTARKV